MLIVAYIIAAICFSVAAKEKWGTIESLAVLGAFALTAAIWIAVGHD